MTIGIDISSYAGYTNTDYKSTLYFPHKDGYDDCDGYWVASPSAYETFSVLGVSYYGDVYYNYYDSYYLGVRPLVCLKSNIQATKVGDIWQLGTN